MSDDVWVLGGTGRTGRAINAALAARGAPVALVGRDAARLEAAAAESGAATVVAGSLQEMVAAIRRERPAVVVNTVGPYQHTAEMVAETTLGGGHYVDLANDLTTLTRLLRLDDDAQASGHTLVTGAGFGVTATESLATWLADGRPPAKRVRVDMIPSVASTAGVVGEALASTLVEGVPSVEGGRRFQARHMADGRLAPARVSSRPRHLTTPDGDQVTTALLPLGELVAAQRATGARFVESASSEAPSGSIARLALPAALTLLAIAPLRRLAARRLAAVRMPDRPRPREHSWAHARIEWTDGGVREGWLQLPEGGETTAEVAAEVAHRLSSGQGRPGAFTPAALFGPSLVEACGGVYSLCS